MTSHKASNSLTADTAWLNEARNKCGRQVIMVPCVCVTVSVDCLARLRRQVIMVPCVFIIVSVDCLARLRKQRSPLCLYCGFLKQIQRHISTLGCNEPIISTCVTWIITSWSLTGVITDLSKENNTFLYNLLCFYYTRIISTLFNAK
jgi:hypothetical protein